MSVCARERVGDPLAEARGSPALSAPVSSAIDVIRTLGSSHAVHLVERLDVVVDVDREAGVGHAAGHVDADRRDLAVLDPHPGELGPSRSRPRASTPSWASAATIAASIGG